MAVGRVRGQRRGRAGRTTVGEWRGRAVWEAGAMLDRVGRWDGARSDKATGSGTARWGHAVRGPGRRVPESMRPRVFSGICVGRMFKT